MSFQNTKHFTLKLITSEHIMGAFYRFHRMQQNISLSNFAKQLRMNKGFLSELENGKRHFPDGLYVQLNHLLHLQFNTDIELWHQSRKTLFTLFDFFFLEQNDSIQQLCENFDNQESILSNSYGFFVCLIIKIFYYLRIQRDNSKIIEIKNIIDTHIDCLQNDELSIYYCFLGIFYKRSVSTNSIALDYFKKSNQLCSPNSSVNAMNTFQLVSVYSELNKYIIAYEKCIECKPLLRQYNNYSRLITIDMFECITLTNMHMFDESKKKLLNILSSTNNGTFNYCQDQIYHNLAWNALLSQSYEECIHYTNLAKDAGDPSPDLCYFIPFSLYKLNKPLNALNECSKVIKECDHFYIPFIEAISAKIQNKNNDFETKINIYYKSLLKNSNYEDIPLIQNFILDYYEEAHDKEMMINILKDIKLNNEDKLNFKTSLL